jgi:hypothetical protein
LQFLSGSLAHGQIVVITTFVRPYLTTKYFGGIHWHDQCKWNGMKTNPLSIKLFAVISVSVFASLQARADNGDGIAANAFAAEKAKASGHERIAEKETGIKAPPGVLIHPVVQNSDVSIHPVPRMRAHQEDYHTQQSY